MNVGKCCLDGREERYAIGHTCLNCYHVALSSALGDALKYRCTFLTIVQFPSIEQEVIKLNQKI